MMKPDKNFKLSKRDKIFMSLAFHTDEDKNLYKQSMIDATMFKADMERKIKKEREKEESEK